MPPPFGTQLMYKPSDNLLLNWSTFIGKEPIGADFTMRYFNNFNLDYTWSKNWRSILGFDYGIQDGFSKYDAFQDWYSPVMIHQYKWSDKWQLAYRMEYYNDAKNTVINVVKLPLKP